MLNWLYAIIAWIVVAIHSVLAPIFGVSSGWSWGLSIVLLTVLMRLLLFPLFVKQIRMQRAMQTMQPRLKELQALHKGDKEKLNQEVMKLYKEHGANPLTGCLPLLLQMPVFFALFRVLSSLAADAKHSVYGMPADLVRSAAQAKVFGAPIGAAFDWSNARVHALGASPTTVKVVAAIMVVLMGATTFWTQRQLMARTAANGGTQMASQQKILLYVLPFVFFITGFRFPIGVLLYWLTTNVWSMAQQHFVIAKMGGYGPLPAVGAAGAAGAAGSGGRSVVAQPPTPSGPSGGVGGPAGGASPRTTPGAGSRPSRPASRPRRRSGRPGGRR